MSSDLDLFVVYVQDTAAFKYYALATSTILFYDHLLTLADEIKYVWNRKKVWTFWFFLANRYFPMAYQFWLLKMSYSPRSSSDVCDETSFFPIITIVVCTLLAQVMLTVRVYAVTRRNVLITTGLAVVTASQLAVGICLVTIAARKKTRLCFVAIVLCVGQPLPPIPLDPSLLCLPFRHKPLEVAYMTLSLFYDSIVFLLIILMNYSNTAGLKVRTILGTIAEDATRYFLVIFTSHFVFEMTLTLGRESIQLLPASGTMVYLPVMISRLMFSLKKASDPQQEFWSFGGPSVSGNNFRSIKFFHTREDATGREDGIRLDTYPRS